VAAMVGEKHNTIGTTKKQQWKATTTVQRNKSSPKIMKLRHSMYLSNINRENLSNKHLS